MHIHIVNLLRAYTRLIDSQLHDLRSANTIRIRRREMVRITRHTSPHELRVNFRTTLFRMLQLLEDQRPGALTDHEAITIPIKGTRSPLRFVVTRRKRHHGAEATHARWID